MKRLRRRKFIDSDHDEDDDKYEESHSNSKRQCTTNLFESNKYNENIYSNKERFAMDFQSSSPLEAYGYFEEQLNNNNAMNLTRNDFGDDAQNQRDTPLTEKSKRFVRRRIELGTRMKVQCDLFSDDDNNHGLNNEGSCHSNSDIESHPLSVRHKAGGGRRNVKQKYASESAEMKEAEAMWTQQYLNGEQETEKATPQNREVDLEREDDKDDNDDRPWNNENTNMDSDDDEMKSGLRNRAWKSLILNIVPKEIDKVKKHTQAPQPIRPVAVPESELQSQPPSRSETASGEEQRQDEVRDESAYRQRDSKKDTLFDQEVDGDSDAEEMISDEERNWVDGIMKELVRGEQSEYILQQEKRLHARAEEQRNRHAASIEVQELRSKRVLLTMLRSVCHQRPLWSGALDKATLGSSINHQLIPFVALPQDLRDCALRRGFQPTQETLQKLGVELQTSWAHSTHSAMKWCSLEGLIGLQTSSCAREKQRLALEAVWLGKSEEGILALDRVKADELLRKAYPIEMKQFDELMNPKVEDLIETQKLIEQIGNGIKRWMDDREVNARIKQATEMEQKKKGKKKVGVKKSKAPTKNKISIVGMVVASTSQSDSDQKFVEQRELSVPKVDPLDLFSEERGTVFLGSEFSSGEDRTISSSVNVGSSTLSTTCDETLTQVLEMKNKSKKVVNIDREFKVNLVETETEFIEREITMKGNVENLSATMISTNYERNSSASELTTSNTISQPQRHQAINSGRVFAKNSDPYQTSLFKFLKPSKLDENQANSANAPSVSRQPNEKRRKSAFDLLEESYSQSSQGSSNSDTTNCFPPLRINQSFPTTLTASSSASLNSSLNHDFKFNTQSGDLIENVKDRDAVELDGGNSTDSADKHSIQRTSITETLGGNHAREFDNKEDRERNEENIVDGKQTTQNKEEILTEVSPECDEKNKNSESKEERRKTNAGKKFIAELNPEEEQTEGSPECDEKNKNTVSKEERRKTNAGKKFIAELNPEEEQMRMERLYRQRKKFRERRAFLRDQRLIDDAATEGESEPEMSDDEQEERDSRKAEKKKKISKLKNDDDDDDEYYEADEDGVLEDLIATKEDEDEANQLGWSGHSLHRERLEQDREKIYRRYFTMEGIREAREHRRKNAPIGLLGGDLEITRREQLRLAAAEKADMDQMDEAAEMEEVLAELRNRQEYDYDDVFSDEWSADDDDGYETPDDEDGDSENSRGIQNDGVEFGGGIFDSLQQRKKMDKINLRSRRRSGVLPSSSLSEKEQHFPAMFNATESTSCVNRNINQTVQQGCGVASHPAFSSKSVLSSSLTQIFNSKSFSVNSSFLQSQSSSESTTSIWPSAAQSIAASCSSQSSASGLLFRIKSSSKQSSPTELIHDHSASLSDFLSSSNSFSQSFSQQLSQPSKKTAASMSQVLRIGESSKRSFSRNNEAISTAGFEERLHQFETSRGLNGSID